MSFDARDIRRNLEVYTFDSEYLGTVVAVSAGVRAGTEQLVPETARQASDVSGEALGVVPTAGMGNRGPDTQGARRGYATDPDLALSLEAGTFTVGRWGGALARRTLGIEDVLSVSMERVVLALTKDELDRCDG